MKPPSSALVALVALVAACASERPRPPPEAGVVEVGPGGEATEAEVAGPAPPSQVAPEGALEGEVLVNEEPLLLVVGPREGDFGPPARVDAGAGEHIGFHLAFEDLHAALELEVLAWDGEGARSLGMTNWGPGLRALAALDPLGPHTFWVRARGAIDEGELTVARTILPGGPHCFEGCDQLLQLPLPLDPAVQGFRIAEGSVYAYQFGRRDLMVALLHAGRRMVEAGSPPFAVKRLSRWDGGQPPSHHSHLGGVDVDLSLYTAAGETVWYPLCTAADDEQSCRPGSRWNFGAEAMALLIAAFFESELFDEQLGSAVFLDREYHRSLRDAAGRLVEDGLISPFVESYFDPPRRLLQHVEPHHHHIHLRVSAPAGD